jgi:hypothetical protein
VGVARHPKLGAAQQLWLLYRNHHEISDLQNLRRSGAPRGSIRELVDCEAHPVRLSGSLLFLKARPSVPQLVSTVVSILALAISMATAWFTLRRGTVRMTQPTTFYFGADASASPSPKVYLRTLLYTTAKRGKIIESMFVKLRRGESIQTFNIWVYGENSLARGS